MDLQCLPGLLLKLNKTNKKIQMKNCKIELLVVRKSIKKKKKKTGKFIKGFKLLVY